eukprot:scaffold93405_cov28-Prasinocladus_malaysianus.AAC.7
MKFVEHKNTDLAVNPPVFKCDEPISNKIKEPLPKTAHFSALIGSAGSGKTSLMINMLTSDGMYKKSFDHVHMCCPKNSLGSLKDDIWEQHPSDKMHESLDYMTLEDIHRRCKDRASSKPSPETTLLIIDDMAVWLKKNEIQEKLRELIYNRRHLRLSIWILVQSYNAMPLSIRKTLSHFFMFKPRNKKEAETLWEELMFMPRKTGDELLSYVYRDQYDFMLGNCNTGEVHRNFNKIDMQDSGEGPEHDSQSSASSEEPGHQ